MRRLIVLVVAAALLLGIAAPPAHAGSRTAAVALGLASFAVFSQVVAPLIHARPAYAVTREVVVERPVVYGPYPQRVVVVPSPGPPPAAQPTVVQYPHGRYELRGDGVYTAYQWVWIPNAPPPPPPPPPALPAPPPQTN